MTITVRAVGRLKEGEEKDLFQRYWQRLRYRLEEILPANASLPVKKIQEQESDALLKGITADAVVILLDKSGSIFSSEELAGHINRYALEGKAVIFLIGGHEGISKKIFSRADLVFSFGRVTWPWRLVRIMLAEQLYRAWTINANSPYHR